MNWRLILMVLAVVLIIPLLIFLAAFWLGFEIGDVLKELFNLKTQAS